MLCVHKKGLATSHCPCHPKVTAPACSVCSLLTYHLECFSFCSMLKWRLSKVRGHLSHHVYFVSIMASVAMLSSLLNPLFNQLSQAQTACQRGSPVAAQTSHSLMPMDVTNHAPPQKNLKYLPTFCFSTHHMT